MYLYFYTYIIRLISKMMYNMEQAQSLIQGQQIVDPQTQENPSLKIRNARINKQLEYLTQYEHRVKQSEDGKYSIIIDNLFEVAGSQYSLTIILPSNYPFYEPEFIIDNRDQVHDEAYIGQTYHISELIDNWSPKYKVCQMIELIRRRVTQKQQLELILSNNCVYQLLKNLKPSQNVKVTTTNIIWLVFLIALLFRIGVGLGGYSGKGDWPNLGDFEAHRNWMSITINRPMSDWYVQSAQEPWWRIDYPPVAAYISFLFGKIYKKIQPEALQIQKGFQSQSLTAYMRFTALFIDVIFLLPSSILLFNFLSKSNLLKSSNIYLFTAFMAVILLKPDQILIDHGHFQYNSLMLGCILYAVYFLLAKHYYLCCLFYTIAVNSKQMAIYYGMAFVFALIGVTFNKYHHYNAKIKYKKIVMEILIYGLIVIITTGVLWLPWLKNFEDFMSVLSAIFPIHRGLYQLKVPNFWCITDPIFKWQSLMSKGMLMSMCMIISFIASIPACLALLIRPSKQIILICFSIISMTFFLFGYHGHEKSVLVPFIMLPFVSQYFGPEIVTDLIMAGCAGMYHLLIEDKQIIGYYCIIALYICLKIPLEQAQNAFYSIYKHPGVDNKISSSKIINIHKSTYRFLRIPFTFGIFVVLHFLKHTLSPPQNLPYLYNLLFACFSFILNSYYLLLANLVVFEEIDNIVRRRTKKKQ